MIAQINMRKGTSAEWAAASPVVLLAGEPGWDTTLRGMKVGDGTTEWAELPWVDSKNNPTVNRPNILHNADFRAPINQRGVSGTISTGTYFYDRWIRSNGTVTTNAAYLTIGASAVIEQRIEGNMLAGKTVTAGVMVGDAVYSGTGVMPTSAGTASVTLTGWGTATLGYATGYMYLRLSPTAESNVQAVKLEIGTVSTLHLDPPVDYGVELAKCQRYLQLFKSTGVSTFYGYGHVIADGTAILFVPLLCQMRIVPTLAISGTFYAEYATGVTKEITGLSITAQSTTNNTSTIWFTATMGTLYATGTPVFLVSSPEDFITLNAEL